MNLQVFLVQLATTCRHLHWTSRQTQDKKAGNLSAEGVIASYVHFNNKSFGRLRPPAGFGRLVGDQTEAGLVVFDLEVEVA